MYQKEDENEDQGQRFGFVLEILRDERTNLLMQANTYRLFMCQYENKPEDESFLSWHMNRLLTRTNENFCIRVRFRLGT